MLLFLDLIKKTRVHLNIASSFTETAVAALTTWSFEL